MGHHTYMREAMPAGMRATCPLCCRPIQVLTGGIMVRHGWNERGRKVGETGLGFQWGECPATHSRPLEQTDEDGLVHLETIRKAISEWEVKLAVEVAGRDHYDHKVTAEIGYRNLTWDAWKQTGLEVVSTSEETVRNSYGREKKVMVAVYRVTRGFTSSEYSSIKSYEQLRVQQQMFCEFNIKSLRDAEDMLVKAIAHHAATEPVRKVETHERTVHLSGFRKAGRTGRPACGSRGRSCITTEDSDKVTCSRCKK
jgi:hypothetical protein